MANKQKKGKSLRATPKQNTNQAEGISSLLCRQYLAFSVQLFFLLHLQSQCFPATNTIIVLLIALLLLVVLCKKKDIAALRSRLIASSSDFLEINWIVSWLSNISRLLALTVISESSKSFSGSQNYLWIVFWLSNLSRLQISRVHPGSQAESLVTYFLFFCC